LNTPAHLIFGLTAFGKAHQPATVVAALAGAAVPDLSLYLLAGVSIFGMGISPEIVFREMYFSPLWQQIFAIDNSFVLWGVALAFALWSRTTWAIAFTGAALLHIALDFPVHMEDARAHFWPLTDWKFFSPISYWDNNHHGAWVGALELAAMAGCCVYVWRKFSEWWVKATAALLFAMGLAPVFFWAFMFASG